MLFRAVETHADLSCDQDEDSFEEEPERARVALLASWTQNDDNRVTAARIINRIQEVSANHGSTGASNSEFTAADRFLRAHHDPSPSRFILSQLVLENHPHCG